MRNEGFTLIEVTIVLILLVALLKIAVGPSGSGTTDFSKRASMVSDARLAIIQEKKYYLQKNRYFSLTCNGYSYKATRCFGSGHAYYVDASRCNNVRVTTKTCSDGSPGFTVTVWRKNDQKCQCRHCPLEVYYDSCSYPDVREMYGGLIPPP